MKRPEESIPQIPFTNLFTEDPLAEAFWGRALGRERFFELRGHFLSMGEKGAQATPLSARADKEGPVLKTHNAAGERIDAVVYHPDYHRLEEMAYGGGIVSIKYDPKFLAKHREVRHRAGFGSAYYFAQSETGLYCPICMTDGVGRVLEKYAAESPIARETIAHLASRDRAELWQGAMFLTERQGGSDVGTNSVQARQADGRWFLSGEKWFCSNVDAEAILALARMPNGPEGTKGLGLFLVLRHRPEKNYQTIRINRLKDKLGVRSMPTGEVVLENSEATLIGGMGEGFKQMAEMLNLSRLYNAVGSVATMRRAILEALAYGSERVAFGRPLWELPLWRSSMADLVAEHLGVLSLVFESVKALDRADGGDEKARRFSRLSIPMAKAISGKLAVFVVSEAMEAIGGNAYIEESILPRLLRDAQVLPIWEGTTNILSLDVMRAMKKEASHEPFFARIVEAIEKAKKTQHAKVSGKVTADGVAIVEERYRRDVETLGRLATQRPEDLERGSRGWLESAARTLTLALLLEQAADSDESEGEVLRRASLAAFRRLAARPYSVMPTSQNDTIPLADTETDLLDAGYKRRTS